MTEGSLALVCNYRYCSKLHVTDFWHVAVEFLTGGTYSASVQLCKQHRVSSRQESLFIINISTESYSKQTCQVKNGLSQTRNILIGHTIFLTSEKYCMTNHRPHTEFFTSKKKVLVFLPLRRASQTKKQIQLSLLSCKPWLIFRNLQGFQIFLSVEELIEGQKKRKLNVKKP